MKWIDMYRNGQQSFRRGPWLPTPLLFVHVYPESVALIWSEADGWMAEWPLQGLNIRTIFKGESASFGGDFLDILVGNIINAEKKTKDEATLTTVQIVAKNSEISVYFLNISERYNFSFVPIRLDLA